MNIHEFQAKQVLGRFGAPVPKGQGALPPKKPPPHSPRSASPRPSSKCRFMPADAAKPAASKSSRAPRRRARSRQVARQKNRDASDRSRRPHRAPHVCRGSQPGRARAVSRNRRRSKGAVRRRHRQHRRRDGNRRSRCEDARQNHHRADRSAARHLGFVARKIAFGLGLKDKQVGQFVTLLTALYKSVRRNRCVAAGNQSSGRHQRRSRDLSRRENVLR